MLIVGVESPDGQKDYVCAAFPSACGKTNFAMLIPPKAFQEEGWKITTVGDDIAWIKPDETRQAARDQPRKRILRRRTGHELQDQSERDGVDQGKHDLHERRPDRRRRRLVGRHGRRTAGTRHRLARQRLDARERSKAAHPNARFTAPITQCPVADENFDDPKGVPVSAFIFGGRRNSVVPLIQQSFNWAFGVYMAATMGSEMTAAAFGNIGEVRRDPFAMLPFAGYHMGDYFAHWLDFGRQIPEPPRIFSVNWFLKDENGKFLWPGYGENMRVLKWIVERARGKSKGVETPLGWMPRYEDMDWRGLDFTENSLTR